LNCAQHGGKIPNRQSFAKSVFLIQRKGAKSPRREEKIPKGFRNSAQPCHDKGGVTLGGRMQIESTLNGLNPCGSFAASLALCRRCGGTALN
jgi:hypothetical protein